jgi:hypothetical protein
MFNTEQERHQAADEYFNEVFGDKFKAMQAQSDAGLRRARNIARTFRFICPSYYIPGKQAWGAF